MILRISKRRLPVTELTFIDRAHISSSGGHDMIFIREVTGSNIIN
jgi:hypothetical protein